MRQMQMQAMAARQQARLVVLLLLFLSHIPYSAPASSSSDPLDDLVAKARSSARNIASSSSSDPSMMSSSAPSGSVSDGQQDDDKTSSSSSSSAAPPPPKAAETEEEAEQRRKHQAEAEAAERQAAAESKEYAKEKGLVSPTNGTGSYKGMAREFIDGHNAYRAKYGVPPLVWDKTVARQARRWSTAMRKDCQLKHSGTTHYGESVFRSHENWNATAKDAIHWWATEEPIYDKNTGKCTGGRHFKECGHFALMVNRKYQRLGCGRAECYKEGVLITCNYYKGDTTNAPSPSPSYSPSSPPSSSSKKY
ncbi:hypothetical protein BS78_09G260800 [Paspalum vaginatum]|nr:hypothetical protein BS78_09G260800 [Paspalum vaginatum]